MSCSKKPTFDWEDQTLSFRAFVDTISPGIDQNLLPERARDLDAVIGKAFIKYERVVVGPIINADEEGILLVEVCVFDDAGNKEPGIMTCERRCLLRTYADLELAETEENEWDAIAAPYVEGRSKYFKVVASLLVHATAF